MARITEFVHEETIGAALMRRKGVKIRGALADFEAEARKANERSLVWLREEAAKNLDASIRATGRPKGSSTGTLKSAVEDPKNHEATAAGFHFMITARVYRMAPYWRNIEQGTDMFMGHRVPLAFQARNGRFMDADPKRYPRDRVFRGIRVAGVTGRVTKRKAGTAYGEEKGYDEGRQSWVTIMRPIEPHWYIRRTIALFESQGMYARYLNSAVQRHNKDLGARLTKANA